MLLSLIWRSTCPLIECKAAMPSIMDRLKALDVHGKVNDEYRVQTGTGAAGEQVLCSEPGPRAMFTLWGFPAVAVTVCAASLVFIMTISQITWYFSVVS